MAIWMNKKVDLKEVPEGMMPVMVQHVDSIYWALADEHGSYKRMAASIMVEWDKKLTKCMRGEHYEYKQESTANFVIITAVPYRGEGVTFFFAK